MFFFNSSFFVLSYSYFNLFYILLRRNYMRKLFRAVILKSCFSIKHPIGPSPCFSKYFILLVFIVFKTLILLSVIRVLPNLFKNIRSSFNHHFYSVIYQFISPSLCCFSFPFFLSEIYRKNKFIDKKINLLIIRTSWNRRLLKM